MIVHVHGEEYLRGTIKCVMLTISYFAKTFKESHEQISLLENACNRPFNSGKIKNDKKQRNKSYTYSYTRKNVMDFYVFNTHLKDI